jgi:type II secretory pathway component PulM
MLWRFSQLPARERLGLGLACAAVLLWATDFFVVNPTLLKLKLMDVEIKKVKSLVKYNRKELRYKDSVEKQYQEVKSLIGVANSDQVGLDFKGDIDDMAPQNSISVKSRKLMEPVTTDFLETYFVNIGGFEADLSALLNFLNELQNAPGLLRVQKLTIQSQAPNSVVKGSMIISKAMTLAEKE